MQNSFLVGMRLDSILTPDIHFMGKLDNYIVKFQSREERTREERRKKQENRVQGHKTLGCISCGFILTYDDKYTHNYLTAATSRE